MAPAYNEAASRANTLIFPLARSAQREPEFQWIGRLIPVNYYLFKDKNRDDISIHDLNAAREYRIGVVNYHVHHEFLLAKGFAYLQPVNSSSQNLRKAALGRIDLFPMSGGGLVSLCAQEQIDCSRFEPRC